MRQAIAILPVSDVLRWTPGNAVKMTVPQCGGTHIPVRSITGGPQRVKPRILKRQGRLLRLIGQRPIHIGNRAGVQRPRRHPRRAVAKRVELYRSDTWGMCIFRHRRCQNDALPRHTAPGRRSCPTGPEASKSVIMALLGAALEHGGSFGTKFASYRSSHEGE